MKKNAKPRNLAARALRSMPGAAAGVDARPKIVRNRKAYSRKGRRGGTFD
ncbi:hypothetical protein [Magnetospirillum sp. ME-1]|nr:hypothetical protein [Magnetospirillum sp. ME-1]